MRQLELSNSTQRDDEYYREQWRAYYAERRRLVSRMCWLAGWLGVLVLLFIGVIEKHPLLGNVVAVFLAILLFVLAAQWFLLTGRSRDGPVHDVENLSSFQHLLGTYLDVAADTVDFLAQKGSEIDYFHYKDERLRSQSPGV